MGNVLAATAIPPPTPGLSPDVEGKTSNKKGSRGNPGPMEEIHKKCKGQFSLTSAGLCTHLSVDRRLSAPV